MVKYRMVVHTKDGSCHVGRTEEIDPDQWCYYYQSNWEASNNLALVTEIGTYVFIPKETITLMELIEEDA